MPIRKLCLLITALVMIALGAGVLDHTGTRVQAAPNDVAIYGDDLAAGWENWSWDTTVNLSNTSPVHAGSHSIAVTFNAGWAGLYLHANALSTTGVDTLRFWIHGGTSGGQQLRVVANNGESVSVTAEANTWKQVDVKLSDLGSPETISDLYWQDTTNGAQAVFYLDDIALVNAGLPTQPPPTPGAGPALSVDAAAGRHAISNDIYGMNFADESLAADLDLPVNRWGGNSTTRYNWQIDVHNTGSDWYFENIPDDSQDPSLLPNGSTADLFVEQNRRTGTQSLLTVPLIGWTPKSRPTGHPYDCGFKVSRYGQQDSVDSWDTDCGNGVHNGTNLTGNNPADTSIAITPAFVQGWINHLIGRYGTANAGGVRFYNLDNEPMLWNSTHRDVHSTPTSYDEMAQRTTAYAAAIKVSDPQAKTLGPVVWGWCAYFYSAADGCGPGSDRTAHGNLDFIPWYLQQLRAYEQQNGVRLLDYLDVHMYPQGQGIYSDNAGSAATQALRLRMTRGLWDPTYVDESWIGQPVQLIPRLKAWVNQNYPGTMLAITEYNFGALGHINGALAQADALGIFGREGLDLATLWGPPSATQPGAFAFRIYRNYNGAGGRFGDFSVSASSADQDKLSIYAAQRGTDQALTIMVINKTSGTLTSTLSLANFNAQTAAQVYRYSSTNLNAIVREADQPVGMTGFSASFPANSITLFVLPENAVPFTNHPVYLPATFIY